MKRIIITLTSGALSGTASGTIVGSTVELGTTQWDGDIPDLQTDSATISIADGPTITMDGNAWRELESNDLEDDFICLLSLSEPRAQKIVDLASAGSTCFRALVVRDGDTESCTVYASAEDDDDFLSEAESDKGHVVWTPSDNAPNSPYFGDRANDVDQVDIADVLADFLADARIEALAAAEKKAMNLSRMIARMLVPGDAADDNQPVDPVNFASDAPVTLERLVRECRQLLDEAQLN